MTAGRPAKYKTVEELEKAIEEYFMTKVPEVRKNADGEVMVDNKGMPIIEINPPTITGLALHLGFCSRQSMYDYEERNDEFSYTIKKARLMCENFAEKMMLSGYSPAGYIFALKNYGWRDRQEIDTKLKGSININVKIEEI